MLTALGKTISEVWFWWDGRLSPAGSSHTRHNEFRGVLKLCNLLNDWKQFASLFIWHLLHCLSESTALHIHAPGVI